VHVLVCVQECYPCHPICTGGCSGVTSRDCNECSGYWEIDDNCAVTAVHLCGHDCVESCTSDYYIVDRSDGERTERLCFRCDDQCEECHGPSAANCTACRNKKLYNNLEDYTEESPVSISLIVLR